jgi:peptidoglycan hydrolase-like protein with peptidoglycan-binding domain
MKSVVISSGHGKYVAGASGPEPWGLTEVTEARRVVDEVARLLRGGGVEVQAFHDDISTSQDANLQRIVAFHNSQTRECDVSVHFNAFEPTTGARGTEVWYFSSDHLAEELSDAMAVAGGLINRGGKQSGDLYFLTNTEEPAVLLEVAFVDAEVDCDAYRKNFGLICLAIAETLAEKSLDDGGDESGRPERPSLPERPDDPLDVPIEERSTVAKGDSGDDVHDLQELLNGTELDPRLDVDGDFGEATDNATRSYQASRGLAVDGICGGETWTALYDGKQPLPPPPHALSSRDITAICDIALKSPIADYSWQDRGVAPDGFTQGMALAFGQTLRKLQQGHPAAVEMAKARTNSDTDALNLYRERFDDLGMSNESAGADTLRHLFALMLGHGMRESSGRHCEGRDLSADNVSSETAESGLFQTSFNAHSASEPEFSGLMVEYSNPSNAATCYLAAFADGVSCDESEWACLGDGDGLAFQQLCKSCPAFAVETCALTLRNLCTHFGPIVRGETELRADADEMLKAVEEYIGEVYGGAVA